MRKQAGEMTRRRWEGGGCASFKGGEEVEEKSASMACARLDPSRDAVGVDLKVLHRPLLLLVLCEKRDEGRKEEVGKESKSSDGGAGGSDTDGGGD